MVAVNSTVGTAVAVAVLVGDGFNAGVSVGNVTASDAGVEERLGLCVAGAGVWLAAVAEAAGVSALTGALPGRGRIQARVIKTIPRMQMTIFFISFPP